jgi:hypothetical protein
MMQMVKSNQNPKCNKKEKQTALACKKNLITVITVNDRQEFE